MEKGKVNKHENGNLRAELLKTVNGEGEKA